jgi:Fe-S-cluster containining protein
MRRIRLAIFGDCPCDSCIAACCKQDGHEYAVLLEGDERRKFAAFSMGVRIDTGGRTTTERVLPYVNGRCQFLGHDDRCTIYEDRPINCRRFECISGFHFRGGNLEAHSEFLKRNPRVRELLEGGM